MRVEIIPVEPDYFAEAVAAAHHQAQRLLPDMREQLQEALRRFVEAREESLAGGGVRAVRGRHRPLLLTVGIQSGPPASELCRRFGSHGWGLTPTGPARATESPAPSVTAHGASLRPTEQARQQDLAADEERLSPHCDDGDHAHCQEDGECNCHCHPGARLWDDLAAMGKGAAKAERVSSVDSLPATEVK